MEHLEAVTHACTRACMCVPCARTTFSVCVLFLSLTDAPFSVPPSHSLSPSVFLRSECNGTLRVSSRARLEPFTPCWVSHRNLLKAHFHPRGTNHRRENPSRIQACGNSPDTSLFPSPLYLPRLHSGHPALADDSVTLAFAKQPLRRRDEPKSRRAQREASTARLLGKDAFKALGREE